MVDSAFDKEAFMHTETEAAMETKFTPVPEGEYNAYIEDVEADTIKTDDGNKPVLQINYTITDEPLKELMDMERVIVRQTVWLDFEEDGTLAFGQNKNVRLGLIRDAVGQNEDGASWSPAMLKGGGPVVIKVGHRYNKVTDEGPYPTVQRITSG